MTIRCRLEYIESVRYLKAAAITTPAELDFAYGDRSLSFFPGFLGNLPTVAWESSITLI
jgi:hypothetical protein